ncbi:hypothetical protein SRRS_22000 [Sporomusa rhizae]|uniref:type 4a pilus biogenesis protein PilO n=1 Tax=Sporomusa rhizae TaxID=357999 RepID=UPI00352A5AAC
MNPGRAKLSVYHKVLLFFAGILLSMQLCYIYIIIPQNQRIAELQAIYQTAIRKNALIQEFAKKNPNIAQYLAEVSKKAVQADTMLPNELDISEFIIQLERTINTSKLQLIEVKAAQVIDKTEYREIPVEIIVQGSFSQMIDFLQKLENMPRFTIVNQINIQSQQGILNSKLNLSIFTYGVHPASQGQ